MRFSLALFSVGLASLVAGQSQTDISSLVSQIPSCAVSCLDTAATSAGCATSDFNCRCDKSAVIGASSGACLARSCSVDDVGETIAVNTRICLALIDGSLATSVPTLPAIPTSLPTITPQKDAATGPGAQIGMAMLAAAGAVAAVL